MAGKRKRRKNAESMKESRYRAFPICMSATMWSMKITDLVSIAELKKVEVDKVVKDYIKIEYAKGGNLYILATQLELIQKYAGADAKNQS